MNQEGYRMQFNLRVIAVFLMLVSLSLTGKALNKELYCFKLDIDPRTYSIQPKYPLSDIDYRLSPCFKVTYDEHNRIVEVVYLENGKPSNRNPDLSKVVISYSGNEETRSYYDTWGNPSGKPMGVPVIKIQYDSNHFPVECENYDRNNHLMKDKKGVMIYRCKTDAQGRIVAETFWNEKDQQVARKDSVYVIKYKWWKDNHLNYNEKSFWNRNGGLIDSRKHAPYELIKYDKEDNLVEFRQMNSDRTLREDSVSVAILHYSLDDKGLLTEIRYYDAKAKLWDGLQRAAIIRFLFDKYGNMTERAVYGTDYRLKKMAGPTIETRKYDDKNKLQETAFWDENRNLKETNLKFAKIKNEYDDKGNLILIKFLNHQNELVNTLPYGLAYIQCQFDEQNRITKEMYYGVDNSLQPGPKGEAIIRWIYGKNGAVNVSYYNAKDQKILIK